VALRHRIAPVLPLSEKIFCRVFNSLNLCAPDVPISELEDNKAGSFSWRLRRFREGGSSGLIGQ
jgi:hypothetical protein